MVGPGAVRVDEVPDSNSGVADARLEARAVVKRYGAVTAVDGASVAVRRGEVMALMGDNGAGKSTLIRCISGTVRADSGEVLLNGEPLDMSSATRVLEQGIETVYQDLALVDPMSATRNIFLGRELVRSSLLGRMLRLVDDKAMTEQARATVEQLGTRIPSLQASVGSMSGGQRQAVAIARGFLWGHKVVILDEPTAALGIEQSEHVLGLIEILKAKGASVILVSHNLSQVWRVADRITVMRRGRTVGVCTTAKSTPDRIVALITGSDEIRGLHA